MEQISKTSDMSTLTSCMNKLQGDGFTVNFKVEEKILKSLDSEKRYKPSQVHIVNFYRFEGPSDPDENAILYAIETDTGEKGMITDAYGAYADPHVSKFMKEVEDIEKKPVSGHTPVEVIPRDQEKPVEGNSTSP